MRDDFIYNTHAKAAIRANAALPRKNAAAPLIIRLPLSSFITKHYSDYINSERGNICGISGDFDARYYADSRRRRRARRVEDAGAIGRPCSRPHNSRLSTLGLFRALKPPHAGK